MKVSEAKTKVCPFMSQNTNVNCICGDCMAWQYTKKHWTLDDLSEEEKNMINPPLWWNDAMPEDDKIGYCKRIEQ